MHSCSTSSARNLDCFEAVDVDGAPHEFILSMVNAEMAGAEIDQAVVAAPPIGVDDGARTVQQSDRGD